MVTNTNMGVGCQDILRWVVLVGGDCAGVKMENDFHHETEARKVMVDFKFDALYR